MSMRGSREYQAMEGNVGDEKYRIAKYRNSDSVDPAA